MLDRLISGAGAVTDGADRSVRLLASGSRREIATTRPGSVLVAALLAILAGVLVLAGIEASDPTTPVLLTPAEVATARNLGDRTYTTMSGSLSPAYVETYEDDNDNGTKDDEEHGVAWYYWLVEPEGLTGVTVRSTRPPTDVFTFRGRGVVLRDPGFLTEDYQPFAEEVAGERLIVNPDFLIDATPKEDRQTVPFDLAGTLPDQGTMVELAASRTSSYTLVCSRDYDRDRVCDPDEQDQYEFVAFDPATRQAIRVLVTDSPDFSEATITGMLRREERSADDARAGYGSDFSDLDLTVSDRYVLDDAAPAGGAPLTFVLSLVSMMVAGTILVGLAGGYLIYRRDAGPLPLPATTLEPDGRIALRITGIVRTPTGREHVREVPGELTRFVMRRPVALAEAPDATDPAGPGDAIDAPTETAATGIETPIETAATTLLVERLGHPQGVALGLGELRQISAGRVVALGGPRPAVRVVAGTGPLFLSFDTEAERDRAAAELLDETGLGPDGKHIRTP